MGKDKTPWEGYITPSRIFGNLYFVGTVHASTHIIDTGDGLIMLDSGYQHSLYIVLHNMHVLGLDPRNLKYILHTHGHIDHMGATRALVELFGCKTFIGAPDDKYVTGELDLTWAKELDLDFIGAFTPNVILGDGDKVKLGNTEITAIHSPGHTPGALSYFFDVTDGKKTYRAALHGGMGSNSMTKAFLESYGLDLSLRDQFIESQTRLAEIPVDIYLGNHVGQNDTVGKIERVLAGEKEAFVDPTEWRRHMLYTRDRFIKRIESGEI